MAAGACRLKPLPDLLLAFTATLVFGVAFIVSFIVEVCLKGPSRVLGGCQRRHVRPHALRADSELGSHVFIRLPNSRIKLHCVMSGPVDKPLLIFLHGFPEFWYSWRHQIKEFSKDYRVAAVDMRGFGDSDKPTSASSYIVDELIEDVDQLITELGYDECTLVGHDWGGVVAWCYAAVYPQRLARLISCNCPHPLVLENTLKSNPRQALTFRYGFFFQIPVISELYVLADDLCWPEAAMCQPPVGAKPGTFSREDIELFKYTYSSYRDVSAALNYYRAFMWYSAPRVERALQSGKITVPTLVVWGTGDALLVKENAEKTATYVEQCTVKYIEGASHWVQQEEPEQVNRHVRQFLEKSS